MLKKVEGFKGTLIPADIQVSITRDYAETAAEKSNELLFHMLIAVFSVTLLILLTLGWRESGILFDPIFQGLAISLMAGEVASLIISRMAVPVLYFMAMQRTQQKEAYQIGPIGPMGPIPHLSDKL